MKTGFVIHKAHGTHPIFMTSNKGLYFSDVKIDIAHIMINTVGSNKNKYIVKEYANACKAHSIQDIIRRPNTKEYIEYVEKRLILNYPITKCNILRAEDISGPNLGSIKGKTTRKAPSKVILNRVDDLPEGMLEDRGRAGGYR